MPQYCAFDPQPRAPDPLPPPRSCDSQFHVFGPPERYPVRAGAAYEMPSATIATALAMHRTLGIERGVIVQATTYGADHQVVLDGLAEAGPGYRGCANAVVLTESDDAYIAKLHDAGIRGARFTRQGLGLSLAPNAIERALARVKELGWYAKFQPEPTGIAGNMPLFRKLDLPVIIDHMARPDPAAGSNEPTLRAVVELLRGGNFWVMLSLSEKISKAGPPWDDVVPIAQAYIATAPGRVIWGSDWPHPVSVKQPPNEGELMELLYRFAPDAAMRRRILVDNPAELFGFE
ncbi:MAG: amidohydrolase family protein [Betaproteobacteria bacterium]